MSKGTKKSDKKWVLSMLITLSFLVAIEIVFTRFLSLQQWNIRFSFGFIPVVIAGIMYGPLAGGLVGAVSDLIGVTLFPTGAFFPGFTLTAFISGFVFGLFLYKRQTIGRIIVSTLVNQVVCSLLLNTYWIYLLYSKTSYTALLSTRLIQFVVMTVVTIVVIQLISKELMPRLKMAMAR